MISVYYNYHYTKRIAAIKEEQFFSESWYKKLFEFSSEEEERRAVGMKMFGNIQRNSVTFRRDRKSRKSFRVTAGSDNAKEQSKENFVA